jgi:hypothetical protein
MTGVRLCQPSLMASVVLLSLFARVALARAQDPPQVGPPWA